MAFRRRRRHCLAQPAAALLLLLLAAAATAARAAIVWGPCPADWYAGEYAGAQDYIDCAQLPVPLSYLEPEGEQLALWLTRVHPPPGTEPEAEVCNCKAA